MQLEEEHVQTVSLELTSVQTQCSSANGKALSTQTTIAVETLVSQSPNQHAPKLSLMIHKESPRAASSPQIHPKIFHCMRASPRETTHSTNPQA